MNGRNIKMSVDVEGGKLKITYKEYKDDKCTDRISKEEWEPNQCVENKFK